MRLALLSDIHGNAVALDAVLADAVEQGAQRHLILGDLVALGPEPVAVLDRLAALPDVAYVRGNTDRYVVTGDVPPPFPDDARTDPRLVDRVVQIARNFTWTQGCLAATGWLDWLAQLPTEQRMALPDGTRLLAIHATPDRDDGAGLHPGLTDDGIQAIAAAADADVVCGGHTHTPLDRRAGSSRIVNLGSVSNGKLPDMRASYVLVDAQADSYTITHRRVAYDRAEVEDRIRTVRHPCADFLIALQRGAHPTDFLS